MKTSEKKSHLRSNSRCLAALGFSFGLLATMSVLILTSVLTDALYRCEAMFTEVYYHELNNVNMLYFKKTEKILLIWRENHKFSVLNNQEYFALKHFVDSCWHCKWNCDKSYLNQLIKLSPKTVLKINDFQKCQITYDCEINDNKLPCADVMSIVQLLALKG